MEKEKITYNHERYLIHIDTVAIALITHGLADGVIEVARQLNVLYHSPFLTIVINTTHSNVTVKECLRIYLEERFK